MSNDPLSQSIAVASEAVSEGTNNSMPSQLTLSNGIVLKIKPVPPILLNRAANKVPEVPVPTFYNPDQDREEENPNHPEYLKAVQERNLAVSQAITNVILLASTEIINVPEGLIKPEDEDWFPLAEIAGIEFDENNTGSRYLAWMQCYAIATVKDMLDVESLAMKLGGMTEQEVQDLADTFRSGEERDADTGASSEQPSENGDSVPSVNNRASRRARRT